MLERNDIKLSAEDARLAVYSDHKDFEVISREIVSERRWVLTFEVILKQESTGNYYRTYYDRGKTESQDVVAYEYEEEVTFEQVFPVQKTITVYE